MGSEVKRDGGKGRSATGGRHIQVLLYRVPGENHVAFASAQARLAEVFRRHGMLHRAFYLLGGGRASGGFRSLAALLGAAAEGEVWVEVETYRDAGESLRVIADIAKDPEAQPLFGRVMQLVAPGSVSVRGDCNLVEL